MDSWPPPQRHLGGCTLVRAIAQDDVSEWYLGRPGKQPGDGAHPDSVFVRWFRRAVDAGAALAQRIDEVQRYRGLVHRNLAHVYQWGAAGAEAYQITASVYGCPLSALLERARASGSPLSVPAAAHVTAELCRALAVLHRAEHGGVPLAIVHRRVMPTAIWISVNGDVVLFDAGVAEISGLLPPAPAGAAPSRLWYLSPEQVVADVIDARADVFQLGVVLHEMLTGNPLFRRDEAISVIDAIRHDPVPRLGLLRDDVPPALDELAAQMLERPREHRVAGMSHVLDALERILSRQSWQQARDEVAARVREAV